MRLPNARGGKPARSVLIPHADGFMLELEPEFVSVESDRFSWKFLEWFSEIFFRTWQGVPRGGVFT
jgi:hypothetical protein